MHRRRSWTTAALGYPSYAARGRARVRGRLLLAPAGTDPNARLDDSTRESYARHGGVIPAVVRAQMGNDAGIVGAALLDRAVRE